MKAHVKSTHAQNAENLSLDKENKIIGNLKVLHVMYDQTKQHRKDCLNLHRLMFAGFDAESETFQFIVIHLAKTGLIFSSGDVSTNW